MKIIANESIISKKVFLIDSDGTKIGEIDTNEAMRMAQEADLDLIQISSKADMPVCKIVNMNKYLYELKQREKAQKKSQKTSELKEIRLSPNIAKNDLKTKENTIKRILKEGDEVKVVLICKGREATYISQSASILDDVSKDLEDCASIKRGTKIEGRNASIILSAKNK